jgi:putative PIN family toxin of toxin-antitoxin system
MLGFIAPGPELYYILLHERNGYSQSFRGDEKGIRQGGERGRSIAQRCRAGIFAGLPFHTRVQAASIEDDVESQKAGDLYGPGCLRSGFMRILLDTNVLIAAFISHGTCAEILEYCVLKHDLISSESLLKEFQEKLRNKFRFSQRDISRVMKLLRPVMQIVDPQKLESRICRDPDDDVVLAVAFAAKCNCILTGDGDLLDLKSFRNIDILLPGDFWRYEASKLS